MSDDRLERIEELLAETVARLDRLEVQQQSTQQKLDAMNEERKAAPTTEEIQRRYDA